MSTVTLQYAKTHLARLIAKVRNGEEINISNGHGLLVRLQPIGSKVKERKPGRMKGRLNIAPEFLAEEKAWE